MSLFSQSLDALTLEETAIYLRLPIETIERQALRGQIPGRRIEDSWRFLKAAIDEWLSHQRHFQQVTGLRIVNWVD